MATDPGEAATLIVARSVALVPVTATLPGEQVIGWRMRSVASCPLIATEPGAAATLLMTLSVAAVPVIATLPGSQVSV